MDPCRLRYELYSRETRRLGVEELAEEHPRLLAYPTGSIEVARRRAGELKDLGVGAVLLVGWQELDGVRILGKGKSSVVLVCEGAPAHLAVKIRRLDSTKPSLDKEAEMLKLANKAGVGPEYVTHNPDVLVMKLVVGAPIERFVSGGDYEMSVDGLRVILRSALVKARRLDEAGISHGELSNPRRHVIITCPRGAELLDFGSSSLKKSPNNLTKLAQALFIGSHVGGVLASRLGVEKNVLISALREYKKDPSERSFNSVLKALGLA